LVLGQCFSSFRDQGRVYVEGVGINVYEGRDGALVEDDICGGDEGEGGGDDQVTFTHAWFDKLTTKGRDDAEVEAGGAAGDADGVARPHVRGEALLELVNARADAEVGGLEHLPHCLDLGSGDIGARHGKMKGGRWRMDHFLSLTKVRNSRNASSGTSLR
jgi:hypothetical protein